MSPAVDGILPSVAARILEIRSSKADRHIVVGIDGVDGSGKTTFAQRLLETLSFELDAKCVQMVSIDDFHNPRVVRYQQGKGSPVGFFEDSFDYESLKRCAPKTRATLVVDNSD